MQRFLLYAACAAAIVLAAWLVIGTRESADSLSGATHASGTQPGGAAGAGAGAPTSLSAAAAQAATRARAQSGARGPQVSGTGIDLEQAARGGSGASLGVAPGAPQDDGTSAAPGAIAPSDAPRVLRSLGEGA